MHQTSQASSIKEKNDEMIKVEICDAQKKEIMSGNMLHPRWSDESKAGKTISTVLFNLLKRVHRQELHRS